MLRAQTVGRPGDALSGRCPSRTGNLAARSLRPLLVEYCEEPSVIADTLAGRVHVEWETGNTGVLSSRTLAGPKKPQQAWGSETQMRRKRRLFGVTCWPLLAMALAITGPALAQKPGGILKLYNIDSPASMSIHEERPSFPRCR